MKIKWGLLDVEVDVIEFSQRDAKRLIDGKRFQNQEAFEQYVVMHCVRNLNELVPTMQSFLGKCAEDGNPLRESDLNHELFMIVVKINPLLNVRIEGGALHIERKIPPHLQKPQKQKSCDDYKCGASEEPVQTKKLEDVDIEDVKSLANRMKQWVVGQDEAIDKIHKSIMIGFTGLKPKDQPVGSFLLLGNTGIGKTYSAQILNTCFIGDDNAFHRLDMSEYAEGHEYTKLIGAPSGYRGYERGGILTNAVGSYPFCTVLADEIEEAHERVRKVFLQIMDEGLLTDGQGNTVRFGSATILMTTNVGSESLKKFERRIGVRYGSENVSEREKADTLMSAVDKFFPRKFLNRLDDVIFFRDLTWDEYLEVTRLEVGKVTHILSNNRSIVVKPADEVITWIRDNSVDPVYGARPIKRFIKTHFTNPLSEKLLDGDIENGDKLVADMYKGELIFVEDKV
jgi:ATP-dependent Clp protease ATP-binding subunit ClpC